MTPVVVICTHARWHITCYNIDSLKAQSVRPKIVLVVSDIGEHVDYQRQYPESVNVIRHPNVPLGAKWQAGVKEAIRLGADPLIILGSDDILGPGYIERAVKKVSEGVDFIGLNRYFIHYKGKAHHFEYKPEMPLGGGRVYSDFALAKLALELFDTRLNKHLDDLAWKKLRGSELNIEIVSDMPIHAIKGSWVAMNPFNPNHPNLRLLDTYDSREFLPNLPC